MLSSSSILNTCSVPSIQNLGNVSFFELKRKLNTFSWWQNIEPICKLMF